MCRTLALTSSPPANPCGNPPASSHPPSPDSEKEKEAEGGGFGPNAYINGSAVSTVWNI